MHDMHKLAVDVIFIQMMGKKGIKKYGERAVADMYKEYTKLSYMKIMWALNPNILTRSHKEGSLRAVNLIKENGTKNLKGGHAHMDELRDATKPNKTHPRQPFLWRIFFTRLIINAHEGIYMVIVDLPGA